MSRFDADLLATSICGGTLPFAVLGLGPNPADPRPSQLTEVRRLDALIRNLPPGASWGLGEGSYQGEREACVVVLGLDWPEDAVKLGRTIGQESILWHEPGIEPALYYCDGSRRVPLGRVRPGPAPSGDWSGLYVHGGALARFHCPEA